MEEARLKKFEEIIKKLCPQPKILITHLDFDAEGGSILLRYLLKRKDWCKCQIVYVGGDDNPQVKAGFSLLGLPAYLMSIDKISGDDLGDVILIDSSLNNDIRIAGKKFNPVIVIDHHRRSNIIEDENNFVWIDPSAGSATTMIGEIFKAFNIEVVDDHEWQIVSTVAALGVVTDNLYFAEKIDRRRDREIWNWLRNYAIDTAYSELLHLNLPVRFFELLHTVTDKKIWVIKDTLLVVNLGLMTEAEADYYLPMFADTLLRNEQIQTVIVWAPVKDIGISGKIRTDKASEDLEELIEKLASSGGLKGGLEMGIGAAGFMRCMDKFSAPDEYNVEEVVRLFDKCLRRALEIN